MNNPFSPPPKKLKVLLSFTDAIVEVSKGFSIARESWEDKTEYILLVDRWLSIKKADSVHQWVILDEELTATDWYVRGKN